MCWRRMARDAAAGKHQGPLCGCHFHEQSFAPRKARSPIEKQKAPWKGRKLQGWSDSESAGGRDAHSGVEPGAPLPPPRAGSGTRSAQI